VFGSPNGVEVTALQFRAKAITFKNTRLCWCAAVVCAICRACAIPLFAVSSTHRGLRTESKLVPSMAPKREGNNHARFLDSHCPAID